MNDEVFRLLLELVMVSDPWPLIYPQQPLIDFLNDESKARGYRDWIGAYHKENLRKGN